MQQRSTKSGMKNSVRNTQGKILKANRKTKSRPNLNADSDEAAGPRSQALHKKSPQNLARHSHDVKPESEYSRGAQNEVGQDMRRSRQKAIEFQKDLEDE